MRRKRRIKRGQEEDEGEEEHNGIRTRATCQMPSRRASLILLFMSWETTR